MHLLSCTNSHLDVTDFVDLGMVKNPKIWISWERNITFLRNKKINLFLRWHILRSYCSVTEVTFNNNKKIDKRFKNRNYSLFFLMGIFLKHVWLIPNILKWQNCKILTKLVHSQNPSRISHLRCSVKKIFLKIYKISWENICVGACFKLY